MLREICVCLFVVTIAGCNAASDINVGSVANAAEKVEPAIGERSVANLDIKGKTLPASGRIAEIAASVMHPVERVLVKPGDVVHQGQPLVEIDAHEPEAIVRSERARVEQLKAALSRLMAMPRGEEREKARAELESAQIASKAARGYVDRLKSMRETDAVSIRFYLEQQTALQKAAAEERAAQAHLDYLLKQPIEHEIAEAQAELLVAQSELEAAEDELDHYTIRAAIDGTIAWLNVTPGTVNRAGTKVWGEIVDLREVDVMVELTASQLNEIDRSQTIEVVLAEVGRTWSAKFVYASPAANRDSGRIPVVLHISEAGESLHCYLNVTVRFACREPGQQSSPEKIGVPVAEISKESRH